MGMQDKSTERKDRIRGTSRPQPDPMAQGGGRARDRAQDMADPMRHPDGDRDRMRRSGAADPMRRKHPEPGSGRPAEEMPAEEMPAEEMPGGMG